MMYFILSPHIPHESKYLDTKKMVMELLNAGAHTDFVNKFGVCPHTGYLKSKIKMSSLYSNIVVNTLIIVYYVQFYLI